MKVLLVNTNRERAPQPVVPLGLCMIAAALEARGFRPRLLDLCFTRYPERDLMRALADFTPQAIGLSIRNLDNGEFLQPRDYLPSAAGLTRVCREHSAAPLLIGGPAVSVEPRRMLDLLGADYALAGEGEEVLPELLARLSSGRSASDLPGLYARGGADPPVPEARVADLRTVSGAQAGRRLDLGRYLRWGSPLPVQSKRGCALKCIHCTYRLIEAARYRLRAPESVVAEMGEARRSWGVRRFEFVDSTFNHPPRHALALCEELVRSDLRAELYTMGLNPAATSQELMLLMKRAGFNSVLCSPDSGADQVLANLRKGFSAEQIVRTAEYSQQAGLPILWSFMFGGPGESEATVRATMKLMEQIAAPRDRILCTVGLRVYPRTELAQIALAEGQITPETDLLAPVFYFSSQISPQRILELLEGSRRRSQMVYLGLLQQRCVPLALRLRAALHLPGTLWAGVPLYNRLTRPLRKGPELRR